MYALRFEVLRRIPFGWTAAGSVADHFLEVLKARLMEAQDQVNLLQEAAHPTTATGTDLDRWGGLLGLNRNPGETDTDFRMRIYMAFRAWKGGSTHQGIVDALASLGITVQAILETREAMFTFGEVWGRWAVRGTDRQRVLIVLPSGLSPAQVQGAVQEIRKRILACVEAMLVWYDSAKDLYYIYERVNPEG